MTRFELDNILIKYFLLTVSKAFEKSTKQQQNFPVFLNKYLSARARNTNMWSTVFFPLENPLENIQKVFFSQSSLLVSYL